MWSASKYISHIHTIHYGATPSEIDIEHTAILNRQWHSNLQRPGLRCNVRRVFDEEAPSVTETYWSGSQVNGRMPGANISGMVPRSSKDVNVCDIHQLPSSAPCRSVQESPDRNPSRSVSVCPPGVTQPLPQLHQVHPGSHHQPADADLSWRQVSHC